MSENNQEKSRTNLALWVAVAAGLVALAVGVVSALYLSRSAGEVQRLRQEFGFTGAGLTGHDKPIVVAGGSLRVHSPFGFIHKASPDQFAIHQKGFNVYSIQLIDVTAKSDVTCTVSPATPWSVTISSHNLKISPQTQAEDGSDAIFFSNLDSSSTRSFQSFDLSGRMMLHRTVVPPAMISVNNATCASTITNYACGTSPVNCFLVLHYCEGACVNDW